MGAVHARNFVNAGAKVVLADVQDEAGEKLAQELGDAAIYVNTDVTKTADWQRAISAAVDAFGGLTTLVNNAGVFRSTDTLNTTDEDWDLVLDINLTGAFKGVREVGAYLAEHGGGSIINIASTAGMKGFANGLAYGATKWGVRGLTKHAAIDLAPAGVRVNSVHPGNINTPMIDGLYDNFNHVPLRRAGEPEEISSLVLYLASDASAFATGSEFVMDGGETAGLTVDSVSPEHKG